MGKWDYIKQIGKVSNKRGDKLLEMMDLYNKPNLQEITYYEAKKFWEKLNK